MPTTKKYKSIEGWEIAADSVAEANAKYAAMKAHARPAPPLDPGLTEEVTGG